MTIQVKAPYCRLTRFFFSVSEKNQHLYENSGHELAQQREEEDGKTFVRDMTNVKGLLLASFVEIFS